MAKKSGKVAPKQKVNKSSAHKAEPQTAPRRLKQKPYRSFRLQKRIKHPVKLPSAWSLTKVSARTLWSHKAIFLGLTLIYAVLSILLGQSISGGADVTELKHNFNSVLTGNFGSLLSSFSIFAAMVGTAGGSTSNTTGPYQFVLILISSLAIIWALRQLIAGRTIRIRDAYYRGMYPLVPFILILGVVGLELIPSLVGSTIYTTVINNGVALYFVEKFVWALLLGLSVLLSLYMLTSSLFALYIVTLPDMTPMKALRSARELVRYRRWMVLRKILFLPFVLLLVGASIMLPVILWLTPLAQIIFFLLTMFVLAAVHAYMYTLYRELLRE